MPRRAQSRTFRISRREHYYCNCVYIIIVRYGKACLYHRGAAVFNSPVVENTCLWKYFLSVLALTMKKKGLK